LTLLRDSGLLTRLDDGRDVIDLSDTKRVIVTKSDGSSLYITRDIAAAIDRLNSLNPDKIFYVVEEGQRNHFENLFEIISRLVPTSLCKFQHVNFGRLSGMSTRKGKVYQ
jgi:arginyl-tRNA synthetase